MRKLFPRPTSGLLLSVLGSVLAAACGSAGPADPTVASAGDPEPGAGSCVASASSKLRSASAVDQSSPVALGVFADGPSAGKTLAFIADEDNAAIVVVDVDSRKEIASHKLEGTPAQLMITDDGRLLVTLRDKSKLAVLHPSADGTFVRGCSIDTAAEPIALAVTPDKQTLLLTAGWGRTREALDASSLAKKAAVKLPREPRTVVVDEDGKTAYVSHAVGAKVSIVDLSTMKAESALDVLVNPNQISFGMEKRPFSLAAAVDGAIGSENGEKLVPGRFGTRMGCQGYPLVKSVSPKGRVLAPQILVDPGDPENRTQGYGDANTPTEVASVGVIDTGTRRFVKASFANGPDHFFGRGAFTNGVESGECLLPRAAAMDDSTATLLVTCLGIDAVVAYDAASANPVSVEKARWDVGSGPMGVAVDAANGRAVVWSQFERSVEVLDLSEMGAGETKVGKPDRFALKPMTEPKPLSVVLGRQIFHSTGDARMSQDGRACASCHPDGRDDAITWATPDGPRRTIMLAGRLQDTAPFSWSGDTTDVRHHLEHTFERLNGQGLRNVELEALVAFIESMPPPPRDNSQDPALVEQGKKVFHSAQAECATCHTAGGSDGKNHDLGIKHRVDRKAAFNTPSLTYLSGRGPFFHDGRFLTLRDALLGSDGQMGHTKHLDEKDLNALEAYLNAL